MGRTWPVGVLAALLASACSEAPSRQPQESPRATATQTPPDFPQRPPERVSPAPVDPAPVDPTPADRASAAPTTTDGRDARRHLPRRSFLTVPAIGLRAFPVVRYRGSPDDGPGTVIQNGGPTASPRGPGGGVGPGVVGNFIVTGHRTSHSAPFAALPLLRRGHRVEVRSAGTVFVYEVTGTRSTSFRSPRSLARQSAAVPGRPGVEPTRAMITLSTCATPEDHAAGNFWADRFGNPEHRIDKIGVLVATRPAVSSR